MLLVLPNVDRDKAVKMLQLKNGGEFTQVAA